VSERPNFLILMSDQHNPHILGCYGDGVVKTPHVDALAANGVLFQHAYCQAPLCVPSRMSFLTGRQPSDIGVWSNGCILPSDATTFAHWLGAEGYETALIGRMHFVGPDQWHGFEKRLVGSLTPVHPGGRPPLDVPALMRAAGQSRPAIVTSGPGRTAYQLYDEVVANATVEYLREKARGSDRPFCAVAGFVLPHCPYVCQKEDWDYYYQKVPPPIIPEGHLESLHPAIRLLRKNRDSEQISEEQVRRSRTGYYGLVTHFDRLLGLVMDALRESGLDENTVVIYTSDHGDMAGEHGLWFKSNFYEGAVSVPLVVSCPGRFESGRRVREIVSLLDIGPTLLEMAGAEVPPFVTGRSLLPLLNGQKGELPAEALSEHCQTCGLAPMRMIRRGRWKLVHYEGYRPQLFDLESDPDEFNDLGEDPAHAEVRQELHERVLADWSAEKITRETARRGLHHRFLSNWYRAVKPEDREQWIAPEGANVFQETRG